MTEEWTRRWFELPLDEKARLHGLAIAGFLFLLHFAAYSTWFIEDAAITFAFARNAALGEGFVAYVGMEPVEGFSNPTWTLLLLFARLLGVSPWIAAKLFGALFGLATLPLAYLWAKRLCGEEPGLYPVVAPIALALSPQFVCWCASGLENPLFCFLMALGGLLLVHEIEARTPPWSALAWSFLAFTRPEAPLYPAAAFCAALAFAVDRNGPGKALGWAWRWALLFALPFGAWHAWRYAYFAWPLPNTYYAKLDEVSRFQPLSWNTRGWNYLRSWALSSAQGFLVPLYVLGQTGLRGRRAWAGLAISITLLALLLPGLDWPGAFSKAWRAMDEPSWSVAVRVAAIAAFAMLLPGIGIGRRGDFPRVLAWLMLSVALFFALYTGGDWMDGFRWISMGIVPLSVLFADALAEITAALGRRTARRWIPLAAFWLLFTVPTAMGIVRTVLLVALPETTPYDVGRRVAYMEIAKDRLHLDRILLLEVDQGAHLWWSTFDGVDIAGLVDVPMGHHKYQKPFISQYVYEERKPDFAHVHAYWATRTRLPSHPEWREYIEIPPYFVSPWSQHAGNHIHKRTFVTDAWEGPAGREVLFGGATRLEGWHVPAPDVAPGESVYLEVGWSRFGAGRPFRAWVFLSGIDRIAVWEIPPGYDWLPPNLWKTGEVVLGRHSLPIPMDLPPGDYDLGFALVGTSENGRTQPPGALPEGAFTHDPRLVEGEVRWPRAIRVIPLAEAEDLADAELGEALATARSGDCEGAAEAWGVARRQLDGENPWQRSASRRISKAIARCLALRAELTPVDAEAVEDLVEARHWDHRQIDLLRVAHDVADRREAEGDAAWRDGDDEAAYLAWRDALAVDPGRTWVRRRAETARDRVLAMDETDTKGSEIPPAPPGGGG